MAKLTKGGVGVAFTLRDAGWTQARIGVELGVTRSNVGRILGGNTWAHLNLA
jgi:transcriptional regulator